MNNPDKQR
jgi:hypothetical protein